MRARREDDTRGGFGDRPDRPRRPSGSGAPYADRPRRDDDPRRSADDARASSGDRPARARRDDDRGYDDRPRSGGPRGAASGRSYGDGDRDRPTRAGGPVRRTRSDGSSMAPEARRAVARGRSDAAPPPDRAPRSWGSVARKGARVVDEGRAASASEAWRDAVVRSRSDEERHRREPPAWEPEVWVEDPAPGDAKPARRSSRSDAVAADRTPARRSRKLPPDVSGELARAAGPTRSAKVEAVLADAAKAYERDRYHDARRLLKSLAERYPGTAAVRELHGLTLYRMGKWNDAVKELEAYRSLTGSYDQHPVLADCNRALRRWKKVEALWDELREASPNAELVAEGRIVMAGSMADRGDVQGAIRLLEKARTDVKRPRFHHLRLWYALADLYERAGDMPRSRELFRTVLRHDHDFADVPERLSALG